MSDQTKAIRIGVMGNWPSFRKLNGMQITIARPKIGKLVFQLAAIGIQPGQSDAELGQLKAKLCHFFLNFLREQTSLQLMRNYPDRYLKGKFSYEYKTWLVPGSEKNGEWIGETCWLLNEIPSPKDVLSEIERIIGFITPCGFSSWLNCLELTA